MRRRKPLRAYSGKPFRGCATMQNTPLTPCTQQAVALRLAMPAYIKCKTERYRCIAACRRSAPNQTQTWRCVQDAPLHNRTMRNVYAAPCNKMPVRCYCLQSRSVSGSVARYAAATTCRNATCRQSIVCRERAGDAQNRWQRDVSYTPSRVQRLCNAVVDTKPQMARRHAGAACAHHDARARCRRCKAVCRMSRAKPPPSSRR